MVRGAEARESDSPADMPRGESGSSPKKRAAATDLHERLGKDELIKRLKVSRDNVGNGRNAYKVYLYRHSREVVSV